jgi:hypothetical protein
MEINPVQNQDCNPWITPYLQIRNYHNVNNNLHVTQPSNTTSMDVLLDGCVIYRLLLVLTQRDVLYQN